MLDLLTLLPLAIPDGTIPAEFDESFYRRIYPDLQQLSDEECIAHYKYYGCREGRIASPAAHRSGFISLIPKSGELLEIGPFDTPVIRGDHVKYFDILSQSELRERARAHGRSTELCPFIDFVSPVGDLTIVEGTYDAVVSSHCIEHQPDLVTHLRRVGNLLRPGGRYFLIIPDKRYCFDHSLDASSLQQVRDAYAQRRTMPNEHLVLQHLSMTTHNDAASHWAGRHDDPDFARWHQRVEAALRELQSGAYVDVHSWQFTPNSFRSIIEALASDQTIPFEAERIYDTASNCNEFTAILRKQ